MRDVNIMVQRLYHWKSITIGKVLVDNDSALNVLPKHVLDEMLVDSTYMLPSTMTARPYDGSLK
jgi:hypothetical protein